MRGRPKRQIQSTPLEDIETADTLSDVAGLMIAVTPLVEMSWGKQVARCVHAGQWGWMLALTRCRRPLERRLPPDHDRPADLGALVRGR